MVCQGGDLFRQLTRSGVELEGAFHCLLPASNSLAIYLASAVVNTHNLLLLVQTGTAI